MGSRASATIISNSDLGDWESERGDRPALTPSDKRYLRPGMPNGFEGSSARLALEKKRSFPLPIR
ncbi:MAG: hypothetical protein F6K44_04055 [Moorea sp. SIO3E2]|nr:hypothetical protein [Moorena sp. SIO3E2]